MGELVLSLRIWLAGLALASASALAVTAQAQPAASSGQQIYETRCKGCHEGGAPRAPTRADLGQRPAADIVQALTGGIMVPMAQGLSDGDKQAVAAYLTSAPATASAAPARSGAQEMPQVAVKGPNAPDPMCASNPPIKAGASDWTSMGVDDASTRFQRHPGLSAADVPRLKVKWAFSMTGGGQPTVVGDWLWMTNRSGKFYALDAKTGCVHWVVNDLVSRTTPMVIQSKISPSGWLTVVSQSDKVVRAFDAQTGKQIWRSAALETHPVSVLTGTPVIVGDRLIVPISSIEEAAAMSKSYSCCTFRGSVAALELATGKLLWKTSMIDEPMRTIREKDGGGKRRKVPPAPRSGPRLRSIGSGASPMW